MLLCRRNEGQHDEARSQVGELTDVVGRREKWRIASNWGAEKSQLEGPSRAEHLQLILKRAQAPRKLTINMVRVLIDADVVDAHDGGEDEVLEVDVTKVCKAPEGQLEAWTKSEGSKTHSHSCRG